MASRNDNFPVGSNRNDGINFDGTRFNYSSNRHRFNYISNRNDYISNRFGEIFETSPTKINICNVHTFSKICVECKIEELEKKLEEKLALVEKKLESVESLEQCLRDQYEVNDELGSLPPRV